MESREHTRFMVFVLSTVLHSVLSTCDRLRTATCIFKNKRLRGIGYNGSLPGQPHCDEAGHRIVEGHCLRTRHGERNALSNVEMVEHRRNAESIVLGTSCLDCVNEQVAEGIKKIHCVGKYKNAKGKEDIDEVTGRAGVELIEYNFDWALEFQKMFDLLTRPGGVLWFAGYRLKITKEPLETTPDERKEQ